MISRITPRLFTPPPKMMSPYTHHVGKREVFLYLSSNSPTIKHAPPDIAANVGAAVERLICFGESLVLWLAVKEKELVTSEIYTSPTRTNGVLFRDANDAAQHASTQKRTAFAQMALGRKALSERKEAL